MTDQLVDSWMINHRINLYLLDAIAPEEIGRASCRERV